jgi:hypothetical protein
MTKQEAISEAIMLIESYVYDAETWDDQQWSEVREVVDKLKEIRVYE